MTVNQIVVVVVPIVVVISPTLVMVASSIQVVILIVIGLVKIVKWNRNHLTNVEYPGSIILVIIVPLLPQVMITSIALSFEILMFSWLLSWVWLFVFSYESSCWKYNCIFSILWLLPFWCFPQVDSWSHLCFLRYTMRHYSLQWSLVQSQVMVTKPYRRIPNCSLNEWHQASNRMFCWHKLLLISLRNSIDLVVYIIELCQ